MDEKSRVPMQDRSQRTHQTLLDALENMLQHQSFSSLSVAEIAAEAGVTTGAIYGRFKDKQGLLHASFDRFREAAIDRQATREIDMKNLPDLEVLEGTIRGMLDFAVEHIALMRAASSINDDKSFGFMREARNQPVDWLVKRLTSSTLDEEELHHRVRFVLRTVTAVGRDTFIAGPGAAIISAGSPKKRKQLLQQLASDLINMSSVYLALPGTSQH